MTTSLFIFAKLIRSFTLLATIVGAIKWLYLKAPSFSFHALNDEGLLITSQEELPVMMQKFIPEVIEGDKRIIIVNGEAIGSINRIPQGGDFRSNLAMGGKAEPTLLTEKEKSICSELSQHFKDEGLFFVGIDVINGMLSEINVTSPTGLREIENLSNKNVSEEVIEILVEII